VLTQVYTAVLNECDSEPIRFSESTKNPDLDSLKERQRLVLRAYVAQEQSTGSQSQVESTLGVETGLASHGSGDTILDSSSSITTLQQVGRGLPASRPPLPAGTADTREETMRKKDFALVIEPDPSWKKKDLSIHFHKPTNKPFEGLSSYFHKRP